jgi:hypothetical protein
MTILIRQCGRVYLKTLCKKPTEVAINLDLGADVADRLYQQFWRLERLQQLTLAYQEIRHYLPLFLKLFKIMKEQKMINEQDIPNALKYIRDFVTQKPSATIKPRNTDLNRRRKIPLSTYLL